MYISLTLPTFSYKKNLLSSHHLLQKLQTFLLFAIKLTQLIISYDCIYSYVLIKHLVQY